ncbi:MAG: hypothetical protein SGI73_07115 [Chloroflexota bacterium]|nr:hypothetical protein [Chloroflexota bacterium]
MRRPLTSPPSTRAFARALFALIGAFSVGILGARAWGGAARGLELLYKTYDEQTTRIFRADIARGIVTELRLPIDGTSHEWSPDGTRIAFVSAHDGDPDIYVTDANGRDLRQLTDNALPDYSPAWSRDGTQIAYASVGYAGRGATDIYVLTLDDSAPPRRISGAAGSASMPRWSADGAQIAFMYAERGVRTTVLAFADGSSAAPASAAPELTIVSEWAWSPDGTRVVFVGVDDPTLMGTVQQLYIAAADDIAGRRRLAAESPDHTNTYDMPTWSPDGTRIAYVATPRVTSDVFVIVVDGDQPPQRISPLPSNDRYPAWSPDGRWIAFTSGDNQFSEIYAVELASGRLMRVTRDRVGDFAPSWRPNSDNR